MVKWSMKFHTMEPIECSIPDTPSYDTPSYDHLWFHKHKMMLYTSKSPLLPCLPL